MKRKKKEALTGYLFLLPSLFGFIVFLAFPIIFSLVLAFTDWNLYSGLKDINFIGIQNFIELFKSQDVLKALYNNLIYTIVVVPVTILISLGVAILLNDKVYFKKPLRLAFFTPYITSIVAVSVIWLALYNPSQGPINQFLISIGIQNPPRWLADTKTALGSITVIMIWLGIGYCMIVYMAALQNIPRPLYEAAALDGANNWKKFRHITWPMMSSTTFMLLITRIITSFEVFSIINVMTGGGPLKSTSVIVYEIYQQSFKFYRFGYASAIAWVLFVIIFIVTAVQWITQKKWVHN
jgi:multiple sugar transport system permease protein